MSKRKFKKNVNAFLATSLVAGVVVPAIPVAANAETFAQDLIISEYIEGSSNNKAIEIYNGTNADIDLSNYTVELYTNGQTTVGNTQQLSGTLKSGEAIILYNSSASQEIKDKGGISSGVANFNGDDTILLKNNGNVIDSIGKIGEDPGTNWSANDVASSEMTLVRKSNITSGDIDPSDNFDPSQQWIAYPQDTFSNLASHEMTTSDSGSVENKVDSVTASPSPATPIASGTEVSLSTSTEGATIYYTTNGENPTTSDSAYVGPIIIENDTTIKAIAVAEGLENSDVKTFEYNVISESDIISIADARVQNTGDVTVKGAVTAKLKNTIHIQDETGAIAVRPTTLNVELGDEVTVTGTLGDYRGLLQLNNSTIIGTPTSIGIPEPIVVAGSQVSEENESELVTVKNVTISGSASNYDATDDTGATFSVRDENNNLGLIPGTTYDSITGIVQQYNDTYQIIPRSANDIVGDVEQPEVPTDVSTIAEARAVGTGATVIIEGIATTKTGLWGYDTFYLQDETAGMFVYSSPQNVQPGDKVKITGKLLTYQNELEIDPTSLEIISSGNPLPEAQVIAPSDVNDNTQGELIKLENITITNLESDSYGTAIFQAVTDTGEQVRVIHDNRTGSDYNELIKYFNEGDKVHLTGIGSIDTDGYHLKTFGLESYDLVNKPAVYVTQAEGTVPVGTKIELKSGIEGAEIYYTTDGSEPTTANTKYVEPIALETGDTTIKAIAVSGENVSEVFNFTYTILNTEGISIRDIQGNGHISKYDGSSVKDITGVVTHVINGSTFVMQDIDNADEDNTTSEAIQVYKSSHNVSIGDKVLVSGIVEEDGSGSNLTKTQINASMITKTGTADLPAPLVIGKDIMPPSKIIDNDEMSSFDPTEDGIDFWESIEFMRVSFPNAKVVGPPYSSDVPIIVESTTNNELNVQGGLNIAEDDYNPEKVFLDNVGFDYQSGDTFNGDVVGVISYSSTGYQLLTNKEALPEVIKSDLQPEITHIAPAEDKLTVASYNIENFSNNKSNTPDDKVARIAKSFVENMKSPDIITLVEVQDNDGETDSGNSDASQSYERLIEAIKAAGGPTYSWTDVAPVNNTNGGAPGGNIRVGYLYNPERVTLVEGTEGTGTEANSWTETGNLTLNPGVIDPAKFNDTRKPIAAEFEFQGERVVVIGAHLNSKGGDQSLWGSNQPPKLNSEAERIGLAQAINDFIDEGLAKNPDLNIVVAGDMNDFEFTPVLDTLKGDVLTNMVDKVPAEDRFSYFFQGNNQVLDHILVSNNLVNATVADMIHINANFTEEQGQASDHDPVLVQIDLKAAESEDPIVVEKVYNLTNYKTGKLIINKPSVSVALDKNSEIKNGIVFTGEYAEFTGEGLANVTLTIKPKRPGAIIDLKDTKVGRIIIDGPNVAEIRNAHEEQIFEYINGAGPGTNPGEDPNTTPDSASIKLSVLSDIHYYDTSLGTSGEALNAYLENDRKLLIESAAVLHSAVEEIKENDSEVVLISGDHTKDGELVSHQNVVEVLKELEAAGKKVYVTHGNHDIQNPHAVSFVGDATESVATVNVEQYKELYKDFGYGEAIAQDPNSLSYVVQPKDGLRIIVMDSVLYNTNIVDGKPKTYGAIDEQRLSWILEQIEDAKKNNQLIIGMTHHGIVEHFEVQDDIFPQYVIEDWEKVSETLANAGLNIVFTGHFHAQDAVSKTTVAGNTIYDIETGSLVTYPSPYRNVEIANGKINVDTETIKEINFNTNGKEFPAYAKEFLENGMETLVPATLAQMIRQQQPNLTEEQALQQAQALVDTQLAPQLDPSITVGSLITDALIQHYVGDETLSPQNQQILQGMTSSTDPMVQMLGNAILSLLNDPSQDNSFVIDLNSLNKE